MFRKSISHTPLTDATTNEYFEHISADSYGTDVSFRATLRALLSPRLASGERVSLTYGYSTYTSSDLSGISTDRAVKKIVDPTDWSDGTIRIHNFANNEQANNYAWLELMKSSFEKSFPEWHILEKMTDFFRKTFYVVCFINPEKKSVIIFTEGLDTRKLHYLECSIVAFMPWYFEGGVSELEMELIQSLREKTPEKYENALVKIAEKLDLRTMFIRSRLRGFETRHEKQEMENLKNNIARYISNIEAHNNSIGDLLRQKNDAETRLLGIKTKIDSTGEESEIMEYFIANKNLYLRSLDNTTMIFVCTGYLDFFDEDMAESMVNNKNSYFYVNDDGDDYDNEEDIELLMRAVFIERKVKMRVCAAYSFNLNGSVSGRSNYSFGPDFNTYVPNPHIDGYSCLGDYVRTINELLAKCDYISAIAQCMASCHSINLGDSVVMEHFCSWLYSERSGATKAFLELPTGEVVNRVKAVEWLKEN